MSREGRRTIEKVRENTVHDTRPYSNPNIPTLKRCCTGLSMTSTALLSILDSAPTAQSTPVAETNPFDNLLIVSPTMAKVKPAVRSPKWFCSALSMFQGDESRLGQCWMELVGVWVDFEVKENKKKCRLVVTHLLWRNGYGVHVPIHGDLLSWTLLDLRGLSICGGQSLLWGGM